MRRDRALPGPAATCHQHLQSGANDRIDNTKNSISVRLAGAFTHRKGENAMRKLRLIELEQSEASRYPIVRDLLTIRGLADAVWLIGDRIYRDLPLAPEASALSSIAASMKRLADEIEERCQTAVQS
jgi:hypothetical protein